MISETIGGIKGHWLRRLIHVITLFIPVYFYFYAADTAAGTGLTLQQYVLAVLIIILIIEALRLLFAWNVFGQRKHEKYSISSFTWSGIAISLVLLLSPDPRYIFPIIWSWALGDPLMGELRFIGIQKSIIILISLLLIAAIWWLCSAWLNIPAWLALIMAPLTVAAEWPNLKWIDDNASMQLLPLLIIILMFKVQILSN